MANAGTVCSSMLEAIAGKLQEPEFIAKHRRSIKDFTRTRTLPFEVVVAFLLQTIGGRSLAHSLDTFCSTVLARAGFAREVTKSAFSQARQKINPSAFSELNAIWQALLVKYKPSTRWRGLRLLAADGSCVHVPANGDTHKKYGDGPRNDAQILMARMVALYDIASSQILQVEIAPYKSQERQLLMPLLDCLAPDDLLILDRGFPALWLMAALISEQRHFCVRADQTNADYIRQFLRSNEHDCIVTQKLTAAARKVLTEHGYTTLEEISLRLIKVVLPNGKIEILVSSLTDQTTYPAEEFAALYRQRWNIEEAFKILKQRLHLEGFVGLSPHAVEQEIHAKILMANIVQILCMEAQERLDEDKKTLIASTAPMPLPAFPS